MQPRRWCGGLLPYLPQQMFKDYTHPVVALWVVLSKGQLPHSLGEPIWGYHRVGYAQPCFTYIICLLVPLGPVTSLAAVRQAEKAGGGK